MAPFFCKCTRRPPHLPLPLLVGLLDDARQLLQLGALVQGDVLAGHDLFLHLGDLVPERLLVLVHVVVVEVLLHLKVQHEPNKVMLCVFVAVRTEEKSSLCSD